MMEKYISWDLKQPGISFSLADGRITIFKRTLDVLEYPEYYRFLFSPEDRLFAVQRCEMSDPGSNRLGDIGQDNYSVKTMDLVRFVYQSCGWKPKITYRVAGVEFPEEGAMQFDLSAAYEIHEGRVLNIRTSDNAPGS